MLLAGPWRGSAPGSPSKINGASALSKGLVFAYSGHLGLDLVGGGRPTNTGASENATFGKRGWSFAGGALGASQLNFGNLAATAALGSTPATWAFFTISNDGNLALATQNDSNGNQGWQVGSDIPNTAIGLEFDAQFTNLRKTITESVPQNVPFTVVYTSLGSGVASDVNIYLNGVLGTTGTSIDMVGANGAASTHPMILGAKQFSASASYNGTIFVALLANRMWSPAEVAAFHRDPYQVFQTSSSIARFTGTQPPGPISGTIAAASTWTGTLTSQGALAGTITASSTFTGTLTPNGSITGTIAATSGFSGTLTGQGALSGTITASSTFTGALISPGALSGVIAATSGLSGTLTGRGALAGLIAASSGLSGTLIDNGTANIIAMSPRDNRTVDIVFNAPVVESDATNPANYAIDHGLIVSAVSRITATHYVMTTSRQVRAVSYTVSISGIREA